MADFITVTALNRYVKTLLENDPVLTDVAIRGEISNFTCHYKTGHCYFSLKDACCSVKAVMFRTNAQRLAFSPQNGMQVLLRGRISLYERDGAFQVYADAMFPDGAGAAAQAFEYLKNKLEAQGLFDPARKKPVPAVPKTIGLITSKTGAALQDILQVAGRRWPFSCFLLCPVNVQGADASLEIASAIRTLDEDGRADVIIVGRGGGSAEDLWVFNHEWIARAAAACHVPIISAVGHQIDVTILDFAADMRAPTPSAAAELAVPDVSVIYEKMKNLCKNIQEQVSQRYKTCYNNWKETFSHPAFSMNKRISMLQEELFSDMMPQLTLAARQICCITEERFRRAAALADSLSPYGVLARGYAIASVQGRVITAAQLPEKGGCINVRGAGYELECIVETVRKGIKERESDHDAGKNL